ncbi:uncharacterized protein J3D65DRAFT_7735 [Phyllosticta citribraziliensis]|uniref:Uncharacterized protein n=1 Tax=Phyllosticta citribraziliensis TaxID=989973 RepID=A0ABR1M8E1_9PEZI
MHVSGGGLPPGLLTTAVTPWELSYAITITRRSRHPLRYRPLLWLCLRSFLPLCPRPRSFLSPPQSRLWSSRPKVCRPLLRSHSRSILPPPQSRRGSFRALPQSHILRFLNHPIPSICLVLLVHLVLVGRIPRLDHLKSLGDLAFCPGAVDRGIGRGAVGSGGVRGDLSHSISGGSGGGGRLFLHHGLRLLCRFTLLGSQELARHVLKPIALIALIELLYVMLQDLEDAEHRMDSVDVDFKVAAICIRALLPHVGSLVVLPGLAAGGQARKRHTGPEASRQTGASILHRGSAEAVNPLKFLLVQSPRTSTNHGWFSSSGCTRG